jgi:hypothetical protein
MLEKNYFLGLKIMCQVIRKKYEIFFWILEVTEEKSRVRIPNSTAGMVGSGERARLICRPGQTETKAEAQKEKRNIFIMS